MLIESGSLEPCVEGYSGKTVHGDCANDLRVGAIAGMVDVWIDCNSLEHIGGNMGTLLSRLTGIFVRQPIETLLIETRTEDTEVCIFSSGIHATDTYTSLSTPHCHLLRIRNYLCVWVFLDQAFQRSGTNRCWILPGFQTCVNLGRLSNAYLLCIQ
jgi:hypothetical protein